MSAQDPSIITAGAGVFVRRFNDGSAAITCGDLALHLRPEELVATATALRALVDKAGPRTILDEAREIIHGDREQTHGEPAKNLRAIGHIWTAILQSQLRPDATITPELVCLMMAGLKLARAANRPSHREHALDTVGYMALMERCGFLDAPPPHTTTWTGDNGEQRTGKILPAWRAQRSQDRQEPDPCATPST